MILIKRHITILFLVFSSLSFTYAQYSTVEFGKNRVQYKTFKWQFYETENFRIYFYQGGQDIGKYVIQSAEINLNEINELLAYKLSKKLDIIVYNDISDMHQTNIGIKDDVEQISGTVQLKNNRLFVYFNGKHSDLDTQIRRGITELFINRLSGANSVRELVSNSFSVDFPYWFAEGLVRYAAEGWTTEQENILRDGILSGRYTDLNNISLNEQAIVGQSVWAMVEQNFGKDAIGNILYLGKVNRSVSQAFEYTTGISLDDFLAQWYSYHKDKFQKEAIDDLKIDMDEAVALKNKKDTEIYNAVLSPDGKYIAYATNILGKWKVHVYTLEDESSKTIRTGGFKTYSLETDLSSPMIAWEPKGKKLSIVYEKKDLFYIAHYDTDGFSLAEKPKPFRKFQKIIDFSYAQDSRNIVMAAMQNGQIDIFTYYIPSSRVQNLTQDFYDDLQPSYVELGAKKGILFISNRPEAVLKKQRLDTILPNGNFDVYFYDYNNPFQKLAQVSFTPHANESYPAQIKDSLYTFLSDYSGKRNQYVGELNSVQLGERVKYVYTTNTSFGEIDSIVLDDTVALQNAMEEGVVFKEIIKQEKVPVIETQGVNYLSKNYNRDIESISIAPRKKKQLETVFIDNKLRFFVNLISQEKKDEESVSHLMQEKIKKANQLAKRKAQQNIRENSDKKDSTSHEKRAKIFQSKFDTWDTLSVHHAKVLTPYRNTATQKNADGYRFTKTRQYFLKFMTENVGVGLNTSTLVTPYQAFIPGTPAYRQADLSGMISFGVTDLFENHKIYGGFSLDLFSNANPETPPGYVLPFKVRFFDNNQFYLTYEHLTKRWDKKITYYRRNFNQIGVFVSSGFPNEPVLANLNVKTNVVDSRFLYPFNMLNSLRLNIGFRNDRNIYKSTDFITLSEPNSSQNWVYTKLSFVHDNTIEHSQNIYNGFKFNGFVEFQKEFPTKEDSVFKESVQLPIFNDSYMLIWGFDARHFQKIHNTIIWANRISYNTSIGTKKMLYYLGATDGIFRPEFNEETIVNLDNNYAYQSAAVNMRGFRQNIRNGNSFIVWNSEIRTPIFTAFRSNPLRSNFLKNFQLIAFYDLGTAWEGITPFSNKNLSTVVRQNAVENPTIVATVKEYKYPFVMGVGLGARMELFGYFLRIDYGWGYDTNVFNKGRLQVSLGLDF